MFRLFTKIFLAIFLSIGILEATDGLVYEGKAIKVFVPKYPLAIDSLQIETKRFSDFVKWEKEEHTESYQLMQNIASVWKSKGITDYLIYGKEAEHSSFQWEIVPYTKEGFTLWKQLKVLWNISFGSFGLSEEERELKVEKLQGQEIFPQAFYAKQDAIEEMQKEPDVFCKQEVLDKQWVFKGDKIYVLYDYAPLALGEQKLHFLLVPKRHCANFADLTLEEYLEAMALAQKLVCFYQAKGLHTVYIFDKTGREAGQSVVHWHKHLVFTSNQAEEVFGKLAVFKKMLLGPSPLSKEELQNRVAILRSELTAVFSSIFD